MPYTPHHSPRLIAHFANTPWQGNNPMEALFLFVGLDANFDASKIKGKWCQALKIDITPFLLLSSPHGKTS